MAFGSKKSPDPAEASRASDINFDRNKHLKLGRA
jgi:hypothetical protein